jgi:hypothetical protein
MKPEIVNLIWSPKIIMNIFGYYYQLDSQSSQATCNTEDCVKIFTYLFIHVFYDYQLLI